MAAGSPMTYGSRCVMISSSSMSTASMVASPSRQALTRCAALVIRVPHDRLHRVPKIDR